MKWLIEETALESLLPVLRSQTSNVRDLMELRAKFAEAVDGSAPAFDRKGDTAIIPVVGPLMPERNPIMDMFGMAHTSYAEINKAFAAADADDSVNSITLDINSPGGTVSGLFETVDLIKDSSKPVLASADLAASAAYAIAAASDRIEAKSRASTFGSIGVAASVPIDDSVVTVTSTNAPNKRPDVTTEEGKATIVAQLDEIEKLFVGSIAEGRSVSDSQVYENFGKGSTFLAGESLSRGMIDGIRSANSGGAGANSQAANVAAKGNETMDLETFKAEHPAVYEAAVKLGVDKERERVGAHMTAAASSGATKLALDAIEAGEEFTQKHMAEHMSAGFALRDQAKRASDEETVSEAASAPKQQDLTSETEAFDREFEAEFSKETEGLEG